MQAKTALLQAIAPINRGLLSSDADRQAIQALTVAVEQQNPTPAPLESAAVEGIWQLLYTTSAELLGIDRIPLYTLGQIYQCIYLAEQRVYNIAEVAGVPGLEGMFTVSARFEPASQNRITVNFERGVLGLQRLLTYTSPGAFIQTLQATEKVPLWQGIDFRINRDRASGWLEVTYLDDDLRISRGNQGSLFVLRKVPL